MKVLYEIKLAGERLSYRIISNERGEEGLSSLPSLPRQTCYGVSVSTTLFGEEEEETVDDFSSDYGETEKFLHLLADNTVLPSTLKEIAEEYIAAKYTV
jgi:hypothetical protein